MPGTLWHTLAVFGQRCPKISFWILKGYEQNDRGKDSITARHHYGFRWPLTHKFLGKMKIGIRIDLWTTIREGERV